MKKGMIIWCVFDDSDIGGPQLRKLFKNKKRALQFSKRLKEYTGFSIVRKFRVDNG